MHGDLGTCILQSHKTFRSSPPWHSYIRIHMHMAFGHLETSLEQLRLEYREGWDQSSCVPVSKVGSLLVSASIGDEQVSTRGRPNIFSPHKALHQSASSSLPMPSISAVGAPGLHSRSHVVSQLGLQSSHLLADLGLTPAVTTFERAQP